MAVSLSRVFMALVRPSSSKLTPFSVNLCSQSFSSTRDPEPISDSEVDNGLFPPSPSSLSSDSFTQRTLFDMKLENGWDAGIYKAILIGEVGHRPMQKTLIGGRTVTTLSLGTGGVRNNRRPLENEEPVDFANKFSVQWHRVSFYQEKVGQVVMKYATPGKVLYLEGNLETKMFIEPASGLVRRIREIAVRRNGRVVFLGNAGNTEVSGGTANEEEEIESTF